MPIPRIEVHTNRLGSQDHLLALSRVSRLAELTLHVVRSTITKSFGAAVEHTFRHVVGRDDTVQHLQCLTLREGTQPSDWDNPWGGVHSSSRVYQATRGTNEGNGKLNVVTRQIRDPPDIFSENYRRREIREEFEKKAKEYLDTMPPAILSQMMIEASSGQDHGTSSEAENHIYDIKTGGWSHKLAQYEEKWRQSNGIMPMLRWQLQKRKEQGWKLWDMPLMQSGSGSEGFLYDRMLEANAET